MKIVGGIVVLMLTSACSSYQFGHGSRVLPGGYDRVAIPVFVNKTHETGVETYFSESLRVEFETSRLAKVTSKSEAQVILEGAITSVSFSPSIPFDSSTKELVGPSSRFPDDRTQNENTMPQFTVLSKEYITRVEVRITARKVSDNKVLWQGDFTGQRTYQAPLLGNPSVNDSNSIYNQRSRQDTVARLAAEMMSEAHDRITENF
ncbi:MAG: hypothetical protein IT289_06935 [Oligoflexia bacterium]|nr:hypothetical protein [Oligoflexia bacterium]